MCGNVDLIKEISKINQIINPNKIHAGKILDIDCSAVIKPLKAVSKTLQASRLIYLSLSLNSSSKEIYFVQKRKT